MNGRIASANRSRLTPTGHEWAAFAAMPAPTCYTSLDQGNHRNMSFPRPIVFWVGMLAVFATLLVLLREVLLPFVTGMVLAYLLNPLAQTIERRGLNRLVATLLILAFVVIAVTVLLILLIPVIVREVAYFIENLPLYIRQLQTLATDPGRPWLSRSSGRVLRMPSARSASLRLS